MVETIEPEVKKRMTTVHNLQYCIILAAVIEVLANTEYTNVCQEHADTLEVDIETGDVLFAGTDETIGLIFRNSNGIICQEYDLDNIGNN